VSVPTWLESIFVGRASVLCVVVVPFASGLNRRPCGVRVIDRIYSCLVFVKRF